MEYYKYWFHMMVMISAIEALCPNGYGTAVDLYSCLKKDQFATQFSLFIHKTVNKSNLIQFQFYFKLVANSCEAREQRLNDFFLKLLFFSWSSKKKMHEIKKKKKKMIMKEIAQSFISQAEESNVVLFISFFFFGKE